MSNKYRLLVLGIALLIMASGSGDVNAFFVATAQNFRGALYQGFGPTPGHASEMAVVKCSQDSFAPRSCRVITVRMECPPPVYGPPIRKPVTKMSGGYAPAPPWGKPMP